MCESFFRSLKRIGMYGAPACLLTLMFLCGCAAGSGQSPDTYSETYSEKTEEQSGLESSAYESSGIESSKGAGGASDSGENSYENIYENIIEAARNCVLNRDAEIPAEYGFSTVVKTTGNYEILGYRIEDIDGNGTDELIFGSNGTEDDSGWDSVVYDIYTFSEGKLVHVLNGWERNRYYLCENGMIANEGSNGAAYSSWMYFSYVQNKLIQKEAVIYDAERDPSNPWFYCESAEYNRENGDSVSEEQAEKIREKYRYRQMEFIPFSRSDT